MWSTRSGKKKGKRLSRNLGNWLGKCIGGRPGKKMNGRGKSSRHMKGIQILCRKQTGRGRQAYRFLRKSEPTGIQRELLCRTVGGRSPRGKTDRGEVRISEELLYKGEDHAPTSAGRWSPRFLPKTDGHQQAKSAVQGHHYPCSETGR